MLDSARQEDVITHHLKSSSNSGPVDWCGAAQVESGTMTER